MPQPPFKALISSRTKQRFYRWRDLGLPGTLMIVLICLLRFSGLMQVQEWMALDSFSRTCRLQPIPNQITLVTIDEADYQSLGEFPIGNPTLASALATLQQYEPRAIGLDIFLNIFKELPDIASEDELHQLMLSMPNVVAVEVALSPTMNIPAPAGMPPNQVGFADIVTDADGKMRRTVLATSPATLLDTEETPKIKYSFAVQLVRLYLQGENIPLLPGATASDPIQFGDSILPQFHSNSGGYVRADASSNQTLMNFCMLQRAYETISLRDLLAGNVADRQLRDRIVIIGNIATSAKESFITAAVRNTLYSDRIGGAPVTTKIIYGIEVHAHVVKQLLRSALNRPCMLKTWPDALEYAWIASWGLLGIGLSIALMSPWKSVLSLLAATACLTAISYSQLSHNLWLPIVPAAMALGGAGLVTAFLDRDMRFELAQQKIAVERTYEAFHNGPLQRLAAILRSFGKSSDRFDKPAQQQLQELNIEMRSIFERMRQETKARGDRLYLIDSTAVDLTQPLPELLYQVYDVTLNQNLPGFASVESYVFPDFEGLSSDRFSREQKRGLCLFLQESLVNIGKYAVGATRIDVICKAKPRQYQLQIIDNGTDNLAIDAAASSAHHSLTEMTEKAVNIGQGTLQAYRLASQMKGTFRRAYNRQMPNENIFLSGMLCELTWPRQRFGRSTLSQ